MKLCWLENPYQIDPKLPRLRKTQLWISTTRASWVTKTSSFEGVAQCRLPCQCEIFHSIPRIKGARQKWRWMGLLSRVAAKERLLPRVLLGPSSTPGFAPDCFPVLYV